MRLDHIEKELWKARNGAVILFFGHRFLLDVVENGNEISIDLIALENTSSYYINSIGVAYARLFSDVFIMHREHKC